jgi:hypothetical protein
MSNCGFLGSNCWTWVIIIIVILCCCNNGPFGGGLT